MSSNFRKRRCFPKLLFNKFDFVPFEVLCSFLFAEEMFNLLMVSKMIRVKIYKVGSSHAKVDSFEIAQLLMAKFPKITLHAPAGLKNVNDSQIITLTRLVELGASHYLIDSENCFKHLTNLTKLQFDADEFSGNAIIQLRKIKSLTMFDNSSVTDAHMKELTTLTELTMYDCEISDVGLVYLTNLKRLDLEGYWPNKITGKGLKILTHMSSLTFRHYHKVREIDLIGMTNLRELKIIGSLFKNNDFLSYMTFLEKLSVGDERRYIGEISFKNFHRLRELEIVNNSAVSGRTLGSLVGLKHLVLRGTRVDGKYLRNMSVRHLEIGNNGGIKAKHLVHLVSVRTLVLFFDAGDYVSDEMVQAFKNVEVIKIVCKNYLFFKISVEAFRPLNKLKKVIVRKDFVGGAYEKFFEERGVELLRSGCDI
ncbi:MAG: hypothetical protein Hyperionvirus6_24 [Hyperionvirus sp.]|uniref:Leucine-rich repeat protein n=1 Tax=Hyperionvirus sp. TaxID=2487770 RepID=A0A3G5ABT4_9VIRU|nr:MAG: hypothetical protein Hyperionvirus6_24 [Hyperionvirus sp.]